MRYLVKLKPLKPFFFGGEVTFGKLGDENSSYLVYSRLFPQQSAVLGMIRKEVLLQSTLLTTKADGESINEEKKEKAKELIGVESFDINSSLQDFGVIKEISPIFLLKENKRFIKKAKVGKYKDGILEGYNPKDDIFDNFVCVDSDEVLTTDKIFEPVTQVGIKKTDKKEDKEDAFYKKTSYLLKDDFCFSFYLEIDMELKSSYIKLGADSSVFKMDITKNDEELEYEDENGYLTLLSDCLITLPLKDNCEFAVTKEISYQNLNTKTESKFRFKKNEKVYLYEKGSVIIGANEKLLENLKNENLQKIGYNKIGGIK